MGAASAQLTDLTQTPNPAKAGIHKSLTEEIGVGRGDVMTPSSSRFNIARDPFRAIRRGRQLFQRKFTVAQGNGPRTGDGIGDIAADGSIGAGLSDSCASCHGRPFGSAGMGGNVFTRPNSRDAPHLFGLGLQEMLADEITADLRAWRDGAMALGQSGGRAVRVPLWSKGINYGWLTVYPDGRVDTSGVVGVDADLRVRPFFAQGGTISIREFVVGALNAEMGLEAPDPDLLAASLGKDVVTPAGMLLSGSKDRIEGPPVMDEFTDPDADGVVNEIPVGLVDYLEFYLLNYFNAGRGEITSSVRAGRDVFDRSGCTECHIPNLRIEHDRRVADVSTKRDLVNSNGVFNFLYATATTRHDQQDDGSGLPALKPPLLQPFKVENFYADMKRHDLGTGFYEKNFDGTLTTQFMTEPLWGVADTAPYGHDGRSGSLSDVILRHGGEALASRDAFANSSEQDRDDLVAFLRSLVLFSPDDTASNLNPADPFNPNFPIDGHGSISLTPLFNDPSDIE